MFDSHVFLSFYFYFCFFQHISSLYVFFSFNFLLRFLSLHFSIVTLVSILDCWLECIYFDLGDCFSFFFPSTNSMQKCPSSINYILSKLKINLYGIVIYCVCMACPGGCSHGWGRPTPTLIPWRQGFRLQQGTSVGVGLPKLCSHWAEQKYRSE